MSAAGASRKRLRAVGGGISLESDNDNDSDNDSDKDNSSQPHASATLTATTKHFVSNIPELKKLLLQALLATPCVQDVSLLDVFRKCAAAAYETSSAEDNEFDPLVFSMVDLRNMINKINRDLSPLDMNVFYVEHTRKSKTNFFVMNFFNSNDDPINRLPTVFSKPLLQAFRKIVDEIAEKPPAKCGYISFREIWAIVGESKKISKSEFQLNELSRLVEHHYLENVSSDIYTLGIRALLEFKRYLATEHENLEVCRVCSNHLITFEICEATERPYHIVCHKRAQSMGIANNCNCQVGHDSD